MKEKKESIEEKKVSYGDILEIFLSSMNNTKQTIPLVFSLLVEECERVQNFVNDFLISEKNKFRELNKKLKDFKDKPTSIKFKEIKSLVHMVYVQRVNTMKEKLSKDLSESLLATEVVPNSLFVLLVTQFDHFMSKIIKKTLTLNPEILRYLKKTYTYSDIIQFENLEDFEDFLIEEEVENIMLKSHSQQFNWVEERLNKELRKKLSVWQTFIELTERKDVLVRNSGRVSLKYITSCKNNRVPINKKLEIGGLLSASPVYTHDAYCCLFEIAVVITQELWRKFLKSDLKNADICLSQICTDLIQNEEYTLADKILAYATEKVKKYSSETIKSTFIINKALSKKLNGKNNMAKQIIKKKDWGKSGLKFQLFSYVILDKFDEAVRMMKKIGKSDGVGEQEYRTWPLFKDFRQSPKFKKAYRNIFESDFIESEDPLKILNEEEYEFLNSIRNILLDKKFSDKQLEKIIDDL